MAQPRPSLMLILDIDERLDSEEARLEINRSYSYVGSTLVRTHAAPEGEVPSNTVRFLVKMGTRKYLYSSDEGADDLWNDVMERWFFNEFHKVGNHMKIYNRRQHEIGNDELHFDWIEIELHNGEVKARLRLDSNSDIDPASSVWLSRLRNALNDGSLGEGVNRVTMPTPASYRQQEAVGCEAQARCQAEKTAVRAAEKAAARAAQEAAEAQAEDDFLESPKLATDHAVTSETEEASTYREGVEEMFRFEDPDFVIDFHLWSIEYADGSIRVFDSETSTFVD